MKGGLGGLRIRIGRGPEKGELGPQLGRAGPEKLESQVNRYKRRTRNGGIEPLVSLLPALLAVGFWGLSWRSELLTPFGVFPRPLEFMGWVLLAVLASLHRPWEGFSLALGTLALVPAIERLGPVPAVLVGVTAYLVAEALRHFAPGSLKPWGEVFEPLAQAHVTLPPLACATLVAGWVHVVWTLPAVDAARGQVGLGATSEGLPALMLIGSSVLFVMVHFLVARGTDRVRLAVGLPAIPETAAERWPSPLLALDAVGWCLGGLAAAVAAEAGWPWTLPLVVGLAAFAAEAARNAILRGVSDHRAGDLQRLQEAHVRILSETAGMGEIAQQVLTECRNVLPVHHFQFERLWQENNDEAPRSWSAGPRGTVAPGEPRPESRPRMLPGVHRRASWTILEKELVAEGETLAVVRLWCDPRRIKPGAEALLTTLVPQMASSVHRARLDREAKLDPLTGVPVRRILERRLQKAYRDCYDEGRSMAVIMCDIDFFKKVNDTYGHAAGDEALIVFARALEAARRETDLLCRYGGEEFTLLLEDTDGRKALQLAERLRQAVEDIGLVYEGQAIPLTMSSGVAAFPELHIKTAGELQLLADEALYQAKESGRNRCLLNLGRDTYLAVDGSRVEGPNAAPTGPLPSILG